MARRPQTGNPHELRRRLVALLNNFERRLKEKDLREQVQALVPALHLLRDLGSSLIPKEEASSARNRILYYLHRYRLTVIPASELAVVAGIDDYTRRIRELRVEHGWSIYSGTTAKEMLADVEANDGTSDLFGPNLPAEDIRAMRSDDYILVGEQDREAAHRWNVANDIRKMNVAVRDRLLLFLRQNVGKPVTGEELRYVARGATEWARRVRELRTQEGWSVVTRNSGRPDLDVGVYVLEADRQSPAHDRDIPDKVRVAVLERDNFQCRCCGWGQAGRRAGDPRTLLELHHVEHHVEGGSNEADNLVTLCNVDHDEVHRLGLNGRIAFAHWLTTSCTS